MAGGAYSGKTQQAAAKAAAGMQVFQHPVVIDLGTLHGVNRFVYGSKGSPFARMGDNPGLLLDHCQMFHAACLTSPKSRGNIPRIANANIM